MANRQNAVNRIAKKLNAEGFVTETRKTSRWTYVNVRKDGPFVTHQLMAMVERAIEFTDCGVKLSANKGNGNVTLRVFEK